MSIPVFAGNSPAFSGFVTGLLLPQPGPVSAALEAPAIEWPPSKEDGFPSGLGRGWTVNSRLELPVSIIALLLTLTAFVVTANPDGAGGKHRMTLAPIDGGSGYYARFHNGLPASPSYFPIGVWFESVVSQADANEDRSAGLNLYVVLTADSNISLVQTNGMRTFLQQEEWRNNAPARASPAVSGWALGDEFDMQLRPRPATPRSTRSSARCRPTGASATATTERGSRSG